MGFIEIFITFIYLLWSVKIINKQSRLLSYLIFGYFGLYIVVLPLFYLCGMQFISVNPDRLHLQEVVFSNLLFIFVFFIITIIGKNRKIGSFPLLNTWTKKVDIEKINFKRVIIPFVVFFFISYFLKASLYHNPLYFLGSVDAFAVTQQTKNGGWFFIVASSALIYVGYMLLYKISNVKKNITALITLIILIVFLSMFLKFAARTEILVMVFAFFIFRTEYIGIWKEIKIYSFRTLLIVLFSIIFLIYYDAIRQNNSINFSLSEFDVSKLMGNFLQIENSVQLVSYFSHTSFLGLQNLFLVLTGYSLLPSFLMPFQKINTGVEDILTQKIFGNYLNPIYYSPNSTLTFSIPMTGYAELGYIGVIIHSIIYSVILISLINLYKKNSLVSFLMLISSITFILGFRLSVESIVTGLQTNIIFYLLLSILYRIKVK